MSAYQADYEYKTTSGGSVVLDADSAEHMEQLTMDYVRADDMFARDIEVTNIREVKNANAL